MKKEEWRLVVNEIVRQIGGYFVILTWFPDSQADRRVFCDFYMIPRQSGTYAGILWFLHDSQTVKQIGGYFVIFTWFPDSQAGRRVFCDINMIPRQTGR